MDVNLVKDLTIKVVSVKGKYDYSHKKGQIFKNPFIGLCPYALHTLWPYITTKRFGGKISWEKRGKVRISCPNPDDLVVFELSTDEY